MPRRTTINFWIDIIIFIGFLGAAVSGLVLLFAPHGGGYQGGRNPAFDQSILLLTRTTWNDLHTWTSLAMTAGVGLHLALHWRWITSMARRLVQDTFGTSKKTVPQDNSVPNPSAYMNKL